MRKTGILIIWMLALAIPARAETSWQEPVKALKALVMAPVTPWVTASPDNRLLLVMERPPRPPISELARPELRLAGHRLDPRTNGRSRAAYAVSLQLMDIETGKSRPVTGLPEDARIQTPKWSPDGRRLAFAQPMKERVELWLVDIDEAAARRLGDFALSQSLGTTFAWTPDSRGLYVKVVPPDRGAPPLKDSVPKGPVVEENLGRKAPARTYQDLLKSPHDEALFRYYFTGQVLRVDLEGNSKPLGEPSIFRYFEPSPNGDFLYVEIIHEPFSYLVPTHRFPRRVEIWDPNGRVVRLVADLPLAENVPIDFAAVPTGPRHFDWRADVPATLVWVEARDGGDPSKKAEIRDTVYTLTAPFKGKKKPLADLALRFGGVTWGRGDLALVTEWWWADRRVRTWRIAPDKPEQKPAVVWDRSWQDRYNDPGSPMTRTNDSGREVLIIGKGESLLLAGEGASPQGNRPFLDRLSLTNGKTARLFRSKAPWYEEPVLLLDDQGRRFITRREQVDQPPNYVLRAGEEVRPLTRFPHPTPQLKGVKKELIRYDRSDKVKLTGTLYLPPGYDQQRDGPLPTLLWVYPAEFKSSDLAGQVRDSPYRFVRVGWWSPIPFLLRGWAVLDDPSLPIVGEGKAEPNDTYVKQLVAGAEAAVNELTRRGVTDPKRVAVGGHSYGAFTTANLLAHTDLFKAGIARSGAYNRTLTPFGFQAEERTLWRARDTYVKMSPFLWADKINEPLLMIHGEADNNSGTYPLQSRRMYKALKGLGAIVRLVMLPHESHGYKARESILHMFWEMDRWLDTYVKDK